MSKNIREEIIRKARHYWQENEVFVEEYKNQPLLYARFVNDMSHFHIPETGEIFLLTSGQTKQIEKLINNYTKTMHKPQRSAEERLKASLHTPEALTPYAERQYTKQLMSKWVIGIVILGLLMGTVIAACVVCRLLHLN